MRRSCHQNQTPRWIHVSCYGRGELGQKTRTLYSLSFFLQHVRCWFSATWPLLISNQLYGVAIWKETRRLFCFFAFLLFFPLYIPFCRTRVSKSTVWTTRQWIRSPRSFTWYYKIIQIVGALWLAIKTFYTSVCKHGFRSSFIFKSWFPTLISFSPNLPSVYIRLCKHGNHFTFLQYNTQNRKWTQWWL